MINWRKDLTMLQFQANGDVIVCSAQPAIGNINVTNSRDLAKQTTLVGRRLLPGTAP